MTTLPIRGAADAAELLRWYTFRWRIEQFHFIMKSGCGIEDRQFQSYEAFSRAAAVFSFLAARVLGMTYAARGRPDAPCTEEVPEELLPVLQAAAGRRGAKTPPTNRQAMRTIGALGGHLGRRRDGEPGVKTLWLGLQTLYAMKDGWDAALAGRPLPPSPHPS